MKRNKQNLVNALMVGVCLIAIQPVTSLATEYNPDIATTSIAVDNNSPMLEKQQKIDKYLFQENADEFTEKGITITYTTPLEKYVEIGIYPFNESNVNYLYEKLGKDNIKIVEGQDVVTLAAQGNVVTGEQLETTQVEPVKENNPEVQLVSTTVDVEDKKSSFIQTPILYGIGGFVLGFATISLYQKAKNK